MKFVHKGLIANKSSRSQVMAYCRASDKPLPESMMMQLTRLQYVYLNKGHPPYIIWESRHLLLV